MQGTSRVRTVWMILSTFYPTIGGDENLVRWMSQRLIEKYNWPVEVLTRRDSIHQGSLPARDMVDSIPITRIWSPGRNKIGVLLYLFGGLWHLLRYGRGGIYEASDFKASNWIATIARYLLGGRSIMKLRTGRYRYEKLFFSSVFSRWYYVTPLRLADCVIAVNTEVERFICELGVPPTRVVCIPNALDTSFFHPVTHEEKTEMRKRLGLPTNKTVFLYIGRLNAIKGIDVLLRAWALVPEQVRDNALLVLVGDHKRSKHLLDMITSLEIKNSILLAGFQRAVRDYYWAADAFVLASRTEGLSAALLEAMACGLPTVVSNVGGSPDVVQDGESGLIFESENHHQLAQRLTAMIDMQARWAEMGAHARQTVVEYADLDVCARQRDELYRQLL